MNKKVKNILASTTAVVFVSIPTLALGAETTSDVKSDTLMQDKTNKPARKMLKLPRNEDCKEVEGKLVCGLAPVNGRAPSGFDEWHEKNPTLNENPTTEKQPI